MFSDSFSGFPDLSEETSSSCKTFFIDLFHLEQQTHLLCAQVSPIDHRLAWVLVGLVGRTLHVKLLQKTVERVSQLAVVPNSSLPLVQS